MKKVLVIDDDTEVRVLICAMLTRGGAYQTVEATNGPAGVETFTQGGFDAVITDLIMPGQIGIETIRELRKIDPFIPIVAVSGFGWDESYPLIQDALRVGADRTLGKPFRADELLTTLRELTSRSGS